MQIASPHSTTDFSALFHVPSIAQYSHEELRHAIDAIATLRARIVRIGYYSAMLCRPDPRGEQFDADRYEFNVDKLSEQKQVFEAVSNLLKNGTPPPNIPPGICNWIIYVAKSYPSEVALIHQITALTGTLYDAILTKAPEANAIFDEHIALGGVGFFDAVTRICDGMWDNFDATRTQGLNDAVKAARQLAQRLDRLEHIGKHVRLVSLNASVEAARAGDAGLGLSVIAQEFKVLAEEIQSLSKAAHDDVSIMAAKDHRASYG